MKSVSQIFTDNHICMNGEWEAAVTFSIPMNGSHTKEEQEFKKILGYSFKIEGEPEYNGNYKEQTGWLVTFEFYMKNLTVEQALKIVEFKKGLK